MWSGSSAGQLSVTPCLLEVLGLEVVEVVAALAVDLDLADLRGPRGRVVAPLQHRALDLAAHDRGLHDDLAVVLAGRLDGRLQVLGGRHPGDAHARAGPGRLDEHGVAQGGDGVHRGRRVTLPLRVGDHGVRADREAGGGEDDLHVVLVHARGGGQHPGADVADVRELEHALQGAVLAERAVQQREDDVDLAEAARDLPGLLDGERAVGAAQGHHDPGVGRVDLGGVTRGELELAGVVVGEDPVAVARDPDRDDVVGVAVDRAHHAGGGRARDGVLRGPSAEDEGDPDLASGCWLLVSHRG